MKATIVVNRHIVASNKKATKTTGKIVDEPALSVRTSKGVVYAKKIGIDGTATLIQDAANARCSGATIWLDTTFQDLTLDGQKACLSMLPKEKHKALAVVDVAQRLLDVSGSVVAKCDGGKRVLDGSKYRIEQSPQGLKIEAKDRGEILNLSNDKLTSNLTTQDVRHFIFVAKKISRELKQIQSVSNTKIQQMQR